MNYYFVFSIASSSNSLIVFYFVNDLCFGSIFSISSLFGLKIDFERKRIGFYLSNEICFIKKLSSLFFRRRFSWVMLLDITETSWFVSCSEVKWIGKSGEFCSVWFGNSGVNSSETNCFELYIRFSLFFKVFSLLFFLIKIWFKSWLELKFVFLRRFPKDDIYLTSSLRKTSDSSSLLLKNFSFNSIDNLVPFEVLSFSFWS